MHPDISHNNPDRNSPSCEIPVDGGVGLATDKLAVDEACTPSAADNISVGTSNCGFRSDLSRSVGPVTCLGIDGRVSPLILLGGHRSALTIAGRICVASAHVDGGVASCVFHSNCATGANGRIGSIGCASNASSGDGGFTAGSLKPDRLPTAAALLVPSVAPIAPVVRPIVLPPAVSTLIPPTPPPTVAPPSVTPLPDLPPMVTVPPLAVSKVLVFPPDPVD